MLSAYYNSFDLHAMYIFVLLYNFLTDGLNTCFAQPLNLLPDFIQKLQMKNKNIQILQHAKVTNTVTNLFPHCLQS